MSSFLCFITYEKYKTLLVQYIFTFRMDLQYDCFLNGIMLTKRGRASIACNIKVNVLRFYYLNFKILYVTQIISKAFLTLGKLLSSLFSMQQ